MKLNDIIDRIKLPFRKEKELFSSLYGILGFYPRNIEYYKQALMHKSIRKRNDKGKPLNNERQAAEQRAAGVPGRCHTRCCGGIYRLPSL